MTGCDKQLEQYLKERPDRTKGATLPEEKRKHRRKSKRSNAPQFGLRESLFSMTGVDLTRIDGIDLMTATTVLSEAGWDMSVRDPERDCSGCLTGCFFSVFLDGGPILLPLFHGVGLDRVLF